MGSMAQISAALGRESVLKGGELDVNEMIEVLDLHVGTLEKL